MLQKHQTQKELRGLKFKRKGQEISHLMYDDVLLFVKCDLEQPEKLNTILSSYCNASSQMINRDKSKVIPNIKLHPKFVRMLGKVFNIPTTTQFPNYLGVSSIMGWSRQQHFGEIIARFENRLAGWKATLLNKAWIPTLVNSVLTALPTYMMSISEFPKCVTKKLDLLRRYFLWGHDNGERKIHLFAWEIATKEERNGGLGIKSLWIQNLELVGKLGWELTV